MTELDLPSAGFPNQGRAGSLEGMSSVPRTSPEPDAIPSPA